MFIILNCTMLLTSMAIRINSSEASRIRKHNPSPRMLPRAREDLTSLQLFKNENESFVPFSHLNALRAFSFNFFFSFIHNGTQREQPFCGFFDNGNDASLFFFCVYLREFFCVFLPNEKPYNFFAIFLSRSISFFCRLIMRNIVRLDSTR